MSDEIIIEIPPPIVKSPKIIKERGFATNIRTGRGYSIGEIREAGLTLALAKDLNMPIDSRRRSVHKVNVDNLVNIVKQLSELINARKTKPAKIIQKPLQQEERISESKQ